MRTIPDHLLAEMVEALGPEDSLEIAIPSYRHENPLLRGMAWLRVDVVARRLAAVARATGRIRPTIFDFGCGAGVLLEGASALAERVYGVDLILGGARLLVERRGLANVVLMNPDEARQIEPASVDLIVAGEVLEHITPLDDTLAFFRSLLRPGGRLLVSLPTENPAYRFGRRLAGFSGHYHHAGARAIDAEIRAKGFRAERRRSIPLPGPLAIYWVIEYRPSP